jgi:hypothetical protein
MRTRRPLLLIVAASACLAILVGVALWLNHRSESAEAGPFEPSESGWSASYDVGYTFTNGWVWLTNMTTQDVELVAVKPVLTGDGLSFIGAKVNGMDRRLGGVQYLPGYPPRSADLGTLAEVEGYVVQPRRAHGVAGPEILIGLKVTKRGRSTIKAIDVQYLQDGEVKTQRIVSTLAVCAPKSVKDCPAEEG